MSIRVHTPGLLTTVQDLGRPRFAHLGISPCGAADALSLRVANRLVGNPDNTPGLEMTLVGPTLSFDEDHTITLAGASSLALPAFKPMRVKAGTAVEIGPLANGARAYLAVQGGIDVPSILGSCSTHLAANFGGYDGRALRKGDVVRVGTLSGHAELSPLTELDALFAFDGLIRVTPGTQWDWFDIRAKQQLLSSTYTVTEQSSRSGLRLSGASIARLGDTELLTEGVSLGAVQVPRDGQPIILFVDQQTTGGYPKIVNVITADLHHVGQLRPRDTLRFRLVSFAEAVSALQMQEQLLNEALPA